MQRVLYVSHSKEVGGAELHLEGLLARMPATSVREAVLVCRTDHALDEWVRRVEARAITVRRLDLRSPADWGRLVGQLRAADLVHLMLAYPVGKYQLVAALSSRLLGRLTVVTHHLALDIDEIGLPGWKRGLWASLFRRYGRLAQRHIAVSASGRELLVKTYGFPAQSVEVIYTGVDGRRYRPLAPEDRAQVRHRLGMEIAGKPWGEDMNIITTVARLSVQKGLGDLVQAGAAVLPRRPRARFVIIGEGDQRATLAAQIGAAGLTRQVFLAGARPAETVASWLAASDLFVLPSHFEGIPLSLLEAMAAGCPPIATSVGGINEVITSDAVGVLTAPHQPAQLAHAILRLLERPDDRARIGAAARARVTHEFDLEAGYARTLALYDELTGRGG
jgi:glycosyltransferase involved in cell wall biosynthesis